MGIMDILKNRYVDEVKDKKKKEEKILPLKQKDKKYFSKIRNAIKKQK